LGRGIVVLLVLLQCLVLLAELLEELGACEALLLDRVVVELLGALVVGGCDLGAPLKFVVGKRAILAWKGDGSGATKVEMCHKMRGAEVAPRRR